MKMNNRVEMEGMLVNALMDNLDESSLSTIRDALSHWVSSMSDMELHSECVAIGANHD